MELLVAFDGDPAGSRMAARLADNMESDGPVRGDVDAKSAYDARVSGFWRSRHYDMITISTPAISADWLEETEVARAGGYDGYVFLSRHSAESGVLALTCHSTGNFGKAEFGGNDSEVALPHPHLQRAYLRKIHEEKERGGRFGEFDITIEATHHGPSALGRPALFIEVGTTPEQWSDDALCGMVADAVHETISSGTDTGSPVAVCFRRDALSTKIYRRDSARPARARNRDPKEGHAADRRRAVPPHTGAQQYGDRGTARLGRHSRIRQGET